MNYHGDTDYTEKHRENVLFAIDLRTTINDL